MRYKDLKEERDAAVARAIEAERMSMKSEFDRVTAEFEAQKARLIAEHEREKELHYWSGFNDGLDAMFGKLDELRNSLTFQFSDIAKEPS